MTETYPLTAEQRDVEVFYTHPVFTNYSISNRGRVIGARGKFLKQEITRDNYSRVTFCKEGKTKRFSVHRLVAIHFIPNPENKPMVNHLDGDKQNNNDWNLEWATSQENVDHCLKMGLQVLEGIGNPAAKLTDKQVIKIRTTNFNGRTHQEIGNLFGVSKTTIGYILRRRNWKHLN